MGLCTTDAIILRRYPYRETSVIVSCLTERYGKIKGLVKGLQAQPSRHRSAMEVLTINRLVFYDTHASQLHLISHCELADSLSQLQQELETAQTAAFFVELVDAVVPLEEPQPATYDLLRQALQRLSASIGERQTIRMHFITRLLRLAGFQPQLTECVACGMSVRRQAHWSAPQGGLLCRSCVHRDATAEAVAPELVAALEALSISDAPPAVDARLMPGLAWRLDAFLRWRLDRPLKTMSQ